MGQEMELHLIMRMSSMRDPILLPEEIEALLRETPKFRRAAFRARERDSSTFLLSEDKAGAERELSSHSFRRDLHLSGFPWVKTLLDFQKDLSLSIDSNVLEELFDLSFLDRGENIVLSGPSGTGKTHLAIALGEKAARLGLTASFQAFDNLIAELRKNQEEGGYSPVVLKALEARVLVLDDLGSTGLSAEDASSFLDFLFHRSSKGGLVLTSRISLIGWNKVFRSGSFSEKILGYLLEHVFWVRLQHPEVPKTARSLKP